MADLGQILTLALQGGAGYLKGRERKLDRRYDREQADAKVQREAERQKQEADRQRQMDAITKALAEARITDLQRPPAAPPPRNIDPRSTEGIDADVERARRIAGVRPQTTPAQSDANDEDEVEGLALLNGNALSHNPRGREQQAAFGSAYRAARARNPTMSPGRLAKQVYEGLKRVNPALFSTPREPYGGSASPSVRMGPPPAPPTLPPPATDVGGLDADEIREAREMGATGAELQEAGYTPEQIRQILGQ